MTQRGRGSNHVRCLDLMVSVILGAAFALAQRPVIHPQGIVNAASYGKPLHTTYSLCVQAPNTVWLDPCEWGFDIPSVTLTEVERSATITISMRKGVDVPIRIDDPGQVLQQDEGKAAGVHLLIGARTAALTFRPALIDSQDGAGRTVRVVIPFDKLVNLEVASSNLKLSDGNGRQFSQPGIRIPVTVPAGQKAATIRLSVTRGT